MSRPLIPEPVKRAAIWLNMARNSGYLLCAETGQGLNEHDLMAARVHFDHAPPLKLRARIGDNPDDRDPASYRPHANDPAFIDVVSVAGHGTRTNKKRGLYRGDKTQIAKMKRLRGETKPRPKRKIPSRPLATNRNGGWKKPLHGNAVRRA